MQLPQKKAEPAKEIPKDRRTLRKLGLRGAGRVVPPMARTGKRGRTGQSAHFKQWKIEAEQRRILSGVRTADLVQPGHMTSLPAAVAEAYPKVWDLVQADRADLLALHGVGPATLRKIQTYLEDPERKVKARWAE